MTVHVLMNWILNFIIILKPGKMMTKHSFTISLLLICAPIMGTISMSTIPNAIEHSNLGMTSVSTMSQNDTTSLSSATTTHLGSSLNHGTTPSELISMTTWQGNASSSPYISMTEKDCGTALQPVFSTHSLCLYSALTLLCILRQKWSRTPAHFSPHIIC